MHSTYMYVHTHIIIIILYTHPKQDQQGAVGQSGGQVGSGTGGGAGGGAGGGGGGGEENPLTPTKEEAATALASLSAEDHEAAG